MSRHATSTPDDHLARLNHDLRQRHPGLLVSHTEDDQRVIVTYRHRGPRHLAWDEVTQGYAWTNAHGRLEPIGGLEVTLAEVAREMGLLTP